MRSGSMQLRDMKGASVETTVNAGPNRSQYSIPSEADDNASEEESLKDSNKNRGQYKRKQLGIMVTHGFTLHETNENRSQAKEMV
jgi:hypothetical protein